MCAVWVELVEFQLQSENPDMEKVYDHLGNIKKHCGLLSYPPGESPEHLGEYQFDEGEGTESGTVFVDGQEMPKSAAEHLDG